MATVRIRAWEGVGRNALDAPLASPETGLEVHGLRCGGRRGVPHRCAVIQASM
jgi:hypothetical protein